MYILTSVCRVKGNVNKLPLGGTEAQQHLFQDSLGFWKVISKSLNYNVILQMFVPDCSSCQLKRIFLPSPGVSIKHVSNMNIY